MLQVDPEYVDTPVAVAVDPDSETALSARAEHTASYAPLITESIDDDAYRHSEKSTKYFTTSSFSHIADHALDTSFSNETIYRSSSKIPYIVRAYPIKVKCSQSLKNIKIVEDGMRLFKRKGNRQFLKHSPDRKMIEYFVEVEGSTGKIIRFSKLTELSDKKLALVANRLIDMIRFLPQDDTLYRGNIFITFYCTGEEIEKFLIKPND